MLIVVVCLAILFVISFFQKRTNSQKSSTLTKNNTVTVLPSAMPTKTVNNYIPANVVAKISPKGKIAFIKGDLVGEKPVVFHYGIYLIDPDGKNETRIIDFPSSTASPPLFYWSDDGSYLAWTRDNVAEFVSTGESTGNVKHISASGSQRNIVGFDFVGNPQKLAVIEAFEKTGSDRFSSIKVHFYNLSTLQEESSQKISLSSEEFVTYGLGNPKMLDENHVVALSHKDDTFTLAIFSLKNPGERKFIDDSIYYVFNVDKKFNRIAYWLQEQGTSRPDLMLYDVASSKTEKLENISIEEMANSGAITFSKDGRSLAFAWGLGDGTVNILYNLDDKKEQKVKDGFANYGSFDLSADGKTLIGTTGYNSNGLELYDFGTKSAKPIASGKDQFVIYSYPRWFVE